jgi:hypothetical protein
MDICLKAEDSAARFILDVYNEGSSTQANINRITTNPGSVAGELFKLSKVIKVFN